MPVLAVSARHGIGVDDLRHEIAGRVSAKKLARERIEADLRSAAGRVQEASGSAKVRPLSRSRVEDLEDAFADSAGVPVVVDAVERSTRLRAGRATTWPLVSALTRFRPDPLKKLGLDLGEAGAQLRGSARSALPAPTPVQRARIDTEVRDLADDASAGLGAPWAEAVRRASTARLPELADRLDSAMARADLGAAGLPVWAGLVRVLQWVLILAAVVGGLWAGLLVVGGAMSEAPQVAGMPLPLLLLVAGVGLGILLALVCRGLVAATARSRAAAADQALRDRVHEVAAELVVDPVAAELAAYSSVQSALRAALK